MIECDRLFELDIGDLKNIILLGYLRSYIIMIIVIIFYKFIK